MWRTVRGVNQISNIPPVSHSWPSATFYSILHKEERRRTGGGGTCTSLLPSCIHLSLTFYCIALHLPHCTGGVPGLVLSQYFYSSCATTIRISIQREYGDYSVLLFGICCDICVSHDQPCPCPCHLTLAPPPVLYCMYTYSLLFYLQCIQFNNVYLFAFPPGNFFLHLTYAISMSPLYFLLLPYIYYSLNSTTVVHFY